MSVTIIRGDALALPLADASVDLVVTSPPYFGLRSYQDGGEHYAGQLGSEPTPTEFVDALIAATREMVRVLKPSGSIWVNLGDKYVADNRGSGGDAKRGEAKWAPRGPAGYPGEGIMQRKSLMGIPWRYALRCIDELGLILRAEVIWSKPNGLPESVTDRVRRSHEQWFHFTKEPRYFSAVDEIREPHKSEPGREGKGALGGQKSLRPVGPNSGSYGTLGALPGSVWTSDYGNGLGESTIGLVLKAVSEGQLTPEEGERILWAGRNDSGPRSTSLATAGGGSASSTDTDTVATGTPSMATGERTDSPTSSPRGRSPEGSTSTTSAATSGASTPTTSSPSPSLRTTPDDLASSSAQRDTTTTSATPTFDATASESAEPAWPTERGSSDDAPPSVWVVPTEPLRVPESLGIDHFAAFPTEWPRRIITGWSPREVCTACGEGRRPVSTRTITGDRGGRKFNVLDSPTRGLDTQRLGTEGVYTLTGYACACPDTSAPATPGVVLDPFGGTGTTALVADMLGRHGISVDLSADYCRLAEWRTTDPGQRARAARVEAVEPVSPDQPDLFGASA